MHHYECYKYHTCILVSIEDDQMDTLSICVLNKVEYQTKNPEYEKHMYMTICMCTHIHIKL